MNMSTAEKFMFDRTFDEIPVVDLPPEIPDGLSEPEDELEEIIPTFSEEEVELARQQGFDAGKQEGLAATTEVLTKQINETLTQINQKLATAFQSQDSVNEELPRAAIAVALGVCKKMLPAVAEKYSFDEIERVLNDVFEKIVEEPSVKIIVHSSAFDEIKDRIDDLSASKGYQGRTIIQADETMAPGDCKIEWANGGSERSNTALWQEIIAIIQRNLGGKPTIWDEPEGMDNIAVTDLTAPEALIEPTQNKQETGIADQVVEPQNTTEIINESLPNDVQQSNTED